MNRGEIREGTYLMLHGCYNTSIVLPITFEGNRSVINPYYPNPYIYYLYIFSNFRFIRIQFGPLRIRISGNPQIMKITWRHCFTIYIQQTLM